MKNEEVHIYFLFDNEYLFNLKRNQGLLKLKLIYEREIDLISLYVDIIFNQISLNLNQTHKNKSSLFP